MVGRLFHEFAITLAATIVISAVVSLTWCRCCAPACCAIANHHAKAASPAPRAIPDAVIARYAVALDFVLARQTATLIVATLTVALTAWLYIVIPKGLFPVQDTGEIQGVSQAGQTISYAAMAQHQQALAAAILKDPDVTTVSSFIGVDGSNTTLNQGAS